jgi:hypothetical protein
MEELVREGKGPMECKVCLEVPSLKNMLLEGKRSDLNELFSKAI